MGATGVPQRDPINALLSFAYSMLAKEMTIIAQAVGLDPYQGFYHQIRYGGPALALDIMEPFRPLIADSAVLWAVNNGVLTPTDFQITGSAANLTKRGRRAFIEALERRLDQTVTHPLFGYRVSYRRLLQVQTRLVARYLDGELQEFPVFRLVEEKYRAQRHRSRLRQLRSRSPAESVQDHAGIRRPSAVFCLQVRVERTGASSSDGRNDDQVMFVDFGAYDSASQSRYSTLGRAMLHPRRHVIVIQAL